MDAKALLLGKRSASSADTWSITVTVSEETEYQTGLPINLYDQDGITITVDWGDGSTSTLTSDDYSAITDSGASIHAYSATGTYTVTIACNDWASFYFESLQILYDSTYIGATGGGVEV